MFASFGKTECKCLQLTNKCNKNDICKNRILGFSNGLKWFYVSAYSPRLFYIFIYLFFCLQCLINEFFMISENFECRS